MLLVLPSCRFSEPLIGLKQLLIGLTFLVGTASANSELPSLGEASLINVERETRLGQSVYDRLLENGLIETNPLLDRYLNDLGFRLLAGVDSRVRAYKFFIVRDDSLNAFAVPGGFIGINRGLIKQTSTQHQLASVIAHEIAHVRLRHGLNMMEKGREVSNAAMWATIAGLLLGGVNSDVGAALAIGSVAGGQQAMVNFTRENEYEADRLGIELMKNAQFDPNGAVEFFKIIASLSNSSELGEIEYLRTHPVGENRIAEAAARAEGSRSNGQQVDDYRLFKDYLEYVASDHLQSQGSPYMLALASIRNGEFEVARDKLDKLLKDDPENIWYGLSQAENFENLDRLNDAEQLYRRLFDIFPGDYVLSLRLSKLYQKSGRLQEALQITRDLENRFPRNRQVYFELSVIYDALEKPALRLLAQAEFHRLFGNPAQAVKLYDELLLLADVDIATESEAREKRLQLLPK